jgi:hypothetical protein
MRISIIAGLLALCLFIGFGIKSMFLKNTNSLTIEIDKDDIQGVTIPQETQDSRKVKSLALPKGFVRSQEKTNSFGYFLQNLPLKPHGTEVLTYSGYVPTTNNTAFAVIDLPVGNKDLLQCADAIMCLRASYLYAQKREKEISFNFVSGFKCDYQSYTEGYRFSEKTNSWVQTTVAANTESVFEKYLELVYTYASTISLNKSLQSVQDKQNLQVGDVFIKAGSPGHCFVVVDKCQNSSGEVRFAIAQGFMPAQSIHLLKNDSETHWFSLTEDYSTQISYGDLLTDSYHKRF